MSTTSLFTFTLDKDDAGDKLAYSSTIFLTKVAFQFALSTMLPSLSYLTILDKYILACMVFSFSVMLQIALCSLINVQEFSEINNEIIMVMRYEL